MTPSPTPPMPSTFTPPTLPSPDPKDPPSGALDDPSLPDASSPCSRSQTDGPCHTQSREMMIGGLVIPYTEARAWFKRAYDIDVNEDGPEDLNIAAYLERDIQERGHPNDIQLAPHQVERVFDFLLVTQRACGPFLKTGPAWLMEVLQDDLKAILNPGKQEERARVVLLQEFGIRATVFKPLTMSPESANLHVLD